MQHSTAVSLHVSMPFLLRSMRLDAMVASSNELPSDMRLADRNSYNKSTSWEKRGEEWGEGGLTSAPCRPASPRTSLRYKKQQPSWLIRHTHTQSHITKYAQMWSCGMTVAESPVAAAVV